ncbi:sigma-70 family RNA polymerase sigma factor [Candidatus Poribacteria bacterium]|nr:sigma-70 family RNA polymerase sigma factor [Candidatus Poribacteria bacterium]MYB63045.1 sigma-70 family RNA polymerase sigma factor [Candidatus Poribacteria bacterium]
MSNDVKSVKNLTDEELIHLVQKRDQQAFAELIKRYTPRIRGVIHANARQHQDAEEIHTDTWMAVWKNIKDLRNIESFGAWLHRIAYNACKRYYTIGRQTRYEIPHDATVIAEQLNEHAAARFREYQLIADIKETIHHLPQKLRSVAKLFYLESWQIKEIASEFNMPIGTVKTKLREIRTLLRKEFDPAPLTAQIEGATMKSESVQSKRIIEKTKKTVKPAIFNVDPNDPTDDNWRLPDGVYARFGKGEVKSVKLSPNGLHFAVGTTNGLWWYDVASMQPISFWDDPQGCVFQLEFSPDGKLVILVTKHAMIKVMDVESGKCMLEIDEQNHYGDIACSSNGKWFAIAREGHVRLLDLHTGEQISQIDCGEHTCKTNEIWNLTFTPDGSLLAAMVCNDKGNSKENELPNPDGEGPQIYVWEPETGKPLVKFPGKTIAISPDSRLIAGIQLMEHCAMMNCFIPISLSGISPPVNRSHTSLNTMMRLCQ